MDETLDLEELCEQCDQNPCECEDWIMKKVYSDGRGGLYEVSTVVKTIGNDQP